MIISCSFLFGGCDNVKNYKTNTWYAGTQYTGTITTGYLTWKCDAGTCILKGEQGDGLNMRACQALSKKVGGLDYYYNDSGMTWSKTQNSSLLDQCNAVGNDSNKLSEQPDTPIRQIEGKLATYPEALRKAGQQGHAIVKFVVDQQGHVQNPVIIEATYPEFGDAVIDAILKSQFRPAHKQGKSVEAIDSKSCVFTIPSLRDQYMNEIKKFPLEFQFNVDKDALEVSFVFCQLTSHGRNRP